MPPTQGGLHRGTPRIPHAQQTRGSVGVNLHAVPSLSREVRTFLLFFLSFFLFVCSRFLFFPQALIKSLTSRAKRNRLDPARNRSPWWEVSRPSRRNKSRAGKKQCFSTTTAEPTSVFGMVQRNLVYHLYWYSKLNSSNRGGIHRELCPGRLERPLDGCSQEVLLSVPSSTLEAKVEQRKEKEWPAWSLQDRRTTSYQSC